MTKLLFMVRKNLIKLLENFFKLSLINLIKSFPFFDIKSAGSYTDRAKLTILSINQIIPALSSLIFDKNNNFNKSSWYLLKKDGGA